MRGRDVCAWRGPVGLAAERETGLPADDVVRFGDYRGALWVGDVDDLWRMGAPAGGTY